MVSIRRHFSFYASKGRDHVLRKQLLSLDALPMFDAAEIGNDRLFTDTALGLQVLDLRDNLLRRPNKSDLLLHNLFIR